MSTKLTEYFIEKRWRDRDIYTYIKILYSIIFVMLFWMMYGNNLEIDKNQEIFYIVMGFLSFFFILMVFSYKGSTPKTLVYSILHLILNERIEREIKINQNYRTSTVRKENKETPNNKIKYIKKYISDKQSMVKFVLERDIRGTLLMWSEFLPLDRLSLDAKKQVLSHDRMLKKTKSPILKKDIEYKFKNYTPREIVRFLLLIILLRIIFIV